MYKSLKLYNCHLFQIDFNFNEKDFDKKAFLADIGAVGKKSKGYGLLFGSKMSKGLEHSHINIFFNKNESSLKAVFHQIDNNIEDEREPYMEDCINWIAQFFKKSIYKTKVRSIFDFDSEYEPVVSLLFPVNSKSKILRDALVSGFAVKFPKDSKISRATVEIIENETNVSISAKIELDLKEFRLFEEIADFSSYAQRLVKKTSEEVF